MKQASEFTTEIPAGLRTEEGSLRNPKEEAYFHWAFPLEDFWHSKPGAAFLKLNAYADTAELMREHWETTILDYLRRALDYHKQPPTGPRTGTDLTEALHA